MDADFAAYFLFVFVAAFTPGSSNVRLASAASKFGWRRVVPHVYGMTAGLMALRIFLAVMLVLTLIPTLNN